MEAIRSGVLPRLQYICQNANSEQLRVNTLVCFAKLVPIIERCEGGKERRNKIERAGKRRGRRGREGEGENDEGNINWMIGT